MRRVGIAVSGLCLPLLCSGCGAGAVGIVFGLLELAGDGGGSGPDLPRVVNLRLLENTPGSGRADNSKRVRIAFDIVETTGEKADVAVTFSSSGRADAQATIAEPAGDLGTASEGVRHVLTWDAAADGLLGFQRVTLRLAPRDSNGEGTAAVLTDAAIGNGSPEVAFVAVDVPLGEDAVSRNVVMKFALRDQGDDPSDIEFFVSTGGGATGYPVPEEHIRAGRTRNVLPGPGDLTWDSIATLGRTDLAGVRAGIRADDGLPEGRGALRWSEPFRVTNNSPPEAILSEPVRNPDTEGPILLQFRLRDDEADPADVILQWSADERSFPDLSDLADLDLRRRVLLDPDERG